MATIQQANDTFCVRRFLQYLRYELVQQRKLFCLGHGAVFVGLFALMMLAGRCTSSVHETTTYYDNGDSRSVQYSYSSTTDDEPSAQTCSPAETNSLFAQNDYVAMFNSWLYAVVLGFGMLVSASMAFWEMKRKSSRMQLLTLPVSTLEKFLVKIAVYVVAFTLTMTLLLIVLDFIRMGIYSLLYPGLYTQHYLSFIAMSLKSGGVDGYVGVNVTMAVLMALLSQAIYFLGGAIFSRYAFFKTFIATFVVGNVLGFVMCWGLSSIESLPEWLDGYKVWLYTTIALFVLGIIGCYVWAYHVFKRKQLV